MAKTKVSFANLKLKTVDKTVIVDINGTEVEVLQYLPVDDKADFVAITVQQATEDGIINPIRLDQWFGLNIMYLYTNFNFTDKQREEPSKLYDMLESNGIIDKVVAAIPELEITNLEERISEYIEKVESRRNSVTGVVHRIIDELPRNMEMVKDILKDFNPEDFKEVIAFAQSANGDRPIPEEDTPVDKVLSTIGQN